MGPDGATIGLVDELAKHIEVAFADYVAKWDLAPPAEAVAKREDGHLFKAGWHLGWVFGTEDGQEYFEWIAEHRMADMEHVRLLADGESVLLDVPRTGFTYPDGATDEYVGRREAEYVDWNRRVYAELSERGLLPPEGEHLAAHDINERLRSGGEVGAPEPGPEIHLVAAGLEESDGLWISAGELGAAVADAGVFVGWLDVVWEQVSAPTWQLRDVTHLPPSQVERNLSRALERARKRRQSKLRECRFCGERNVPGHMHSKDVCQGCAERHLGVVH